MISEFDEFPIHQTSDPIAVPASGDRNVYDRYWFNGYAEDGEFYFGIGAALYPNRGIMDCGFSIVRDGEQHAFHASRRMPKEPTQLEIGPFRIEVRDPMRRLRVVLAPNETGIECELDFAARTGAIQEGRQTLRRGERLIMDVTRFASVWRVPERADHLAFQHALVHFNDRDGRFAGVLQQRNEQAGWQRRVCERLFT